MSGFFDRIKNTFGSSKKTPKFKAYEPQQIKMIALRTRVILTENMDHLLKQISAQDQKFKFVGNNPSQTYAVLQSIGEKVIQAESIKIFVEMMRKVENNCTNIAKTNGDIALLRTEVQWFQCVLWYRRSKEVSKLDDFYNFCMDFFKGVDVTREMDVNCEVFKLYPILKYLKKNEVLPLAQVLFYLQPYVSCNIDKPTLDAIFQVNKEDIMLRSIDRASYEHPSYKNKQASRVFPKSAPFTIQKNSPRKSNNPYEMQQSFNPQQYQANKSQIPMPYDNYKNSNIGNIQGNSNFNYQNTGQYSYNGNTMNLVYNQNNNQFQQPPNPYSFNIEGGFAAQNSNYNMPGPSHVDHNPFSNSKFQNSTYNQQQNTQINPIEEKKPVPAVQPKKSFFNSLMRANSKQQNRNTSESNYFVINDRQREKGDFVYNQANQSFIPLNRQSYDQFNNTLNYGKDYELQRKRLIQEEQMLKRQQQEKRRKEEQQRRIQLQRQRQKAEEQQRKRKEEEQIRKKQEQAERLVQEQQARCQREQDQRERQRESRMRERERQEQRQLNVFVDNQRETIDRGYSGRFSSNMGFKVDFDDYQAQQFENNNLDMNNSSILCFKKDLSPTVEAINLQEKDEAQSLSFVEKGHSSNANEPFKLFYFKKT